MFKLVDIDDCLVDPETIIAEWEGKPRCLSSALAYAEFGWFVFPVPLGTKMSHKSAKYSGGRPWGMTKDAAEIRRNWRQWPDAGIGVPTGAVNNIFVVEADTIAGHGVDGISALQELEARNEPLPATLMSMSPSGSVHRYFNHPGCHIKCTASTLANGVDVKGDGGMVIAPPTVKSGVGSYRWIDQLEIADAPDWLLTLVTDDTTAADRQRRGEAETEEEPDHDMIAAALKVIPNVDIDWEDWNKIGMATWEGTGGSVVGFRAFDAWSRKSKKKYNANKTMEKWQAYLTCPPNQITGRTILWLADAEDSEWRDRFDTEELGEPGDAPRIDDTDDDTHRSMPPSRPADVPVDLWAKFDPPPLPTGLLPLTIEEFAFAKGRLMGADPAGLAAAALAVCAAALPDHVKLKVKRHDSWMEETRLWVGLVGDPSSKKTPMISQATWPIRRIDAGMWREYLRKKRAWDALSREERRVTPQPAQTRICIEDTTVEAAQEVLRDSPNGMLCVRDEMSGWFGAMDRYAGNRGAMADRGFWLQAYNGGTYSYNRVSRGSGVIENLSVSMLGGIQPEPMREIVDGTVDDGLIQRIIPIMVRTATLGMDAPTSDAEDRYGRLVERLARTREPFDCLGFDDAAMQVREQLEQKHLDLMACRTLNRKLAAHIGKYDGIFARMCLLWHVIEDEEMTNVVGADTAQRVADFLHRFLLPHAMAFYTTVFGLSDDNNRLMDVAGYILAHDVEVVTNRVIQRGSSSMRGLRARDVDNIMHQLDALGWVNRVQGARINVVKWKVNPEVHRLFRERAEQEAERRRRDRETILALMRGR
jgi:Protein of unknown function (DUF3987)/Bifunctional DNA primase/polymerase, N-terminal/Primase C terminal 2 (PriCT-2)